MKTLLAATVAVLFATSPLAAQPPQISQAAVLRTYAESVPVGTQVKVRMRSGEHLSAVLFGADATGIIVKPKTRIPEPSRRIDFAEIDALRRDDGGIHWGRAASIGAGIGAGVFLIVLGAAR
jgi:hypothetical protein